MTNAEALEILEARHMCAVYVNSEYVDNVEIKAIEKAIVALAQAEAGQENGALPMGAKGKEILLTLIKGLTKRANITQYDEGIKIIKGKDVDLLEEVIKKM